MRAFAVAARASSVRSAAAGTHTTEAAEEVEARLGAVICRVPPALAISFFAPSAAHADIDLSVEA